MTAPAEDPDTDVVTGVPDLDAALGEFGPNDWPDQVQIFQYDEAAGRMSYVMIRDMDSFTLDWVQRTLGAGRYQFKLMRERKYKKSVTVDIALPPGMRDPVATQSDGGGGDRLARIEARLDALAAAAAAPNNGGLTSDIVTALLGNQANMMMPLLTLIMERERKDAADMLAMGRDFMDLGKELGAAKGGKDDGESFAGMMTQVLSELRGGSGGAPAAPPRPAPELQPPAGADDGAAPLLPEWAQLVRPHLATLSSGLRYRIPLDVIADQIEENMPPRILDAILGDPAAALEIIIGMEPSLQNLRQPLADLLTLLTNPEGEEDPAPPAGPVRVRTGGDHA